MQTFQVFRWRNGAAEKHVCALYMHHHWPEHQQYSHIMCHWHTVNRHVIFHSIFHSDEKSSGNGISLYILTVISTVWCAYRVPTEYRVSGYGKCLYTYLYNVTKLHHLTAHWQWLHIMWPTPCMDHWGCIRIIYIYGVCNGWVFISVNHFNGT